MPASREQLAAPTSRAASKSPASSTVSVASSDELRKSGDGTLDKFRRRASLDARSDTSDSNRRRMSRIFKGRSKRRKSATSQDDVSQLDPDDDASVRRPSAGPPNQSDDSLGLHRSVASSLLTEDSDDDA